MPGFDGTGPMGRGAMTGGGFGPCATTADGSFARGAGRGMGRGMGAGRGFRRRAFWNVAPAGIDADLIAENSALRQESDMLRNRLENIEKTLSEMGKNGVAPLGE